MSINTACPSCGFAGRVPDDCRGRRVTCPKCKTSFLVPRAPGGFANLDALHADESEEAARPVMMPPKAPPAEGPATAPRPLPARPVIVPPKTQAAAKPAAPP